MVMSLSTMMSAVQDSPVFAVAQEILVLAVFFTSFVLWRKVNSKNPKNQKCRTVLTCQAQNHATPGAFAAQKSLKEAFATQGSRTDSADEGRLHHVLEQGSRPTVQPQSRATEQQMLKLLEQREFTRALNMYRACERDGRDRHFTNEELFPLSSSLPSGWAKLTCWRGCCVQCDATGSCLRSNFGKPH